MNPALFSSTRQDWETPDEILEVVRKVGPIVLDPCTTKTNPTQAEHFYTEEQDGLKTDWNWINGVCFVNPPYGTALQKWSTKIANEGSTVCAQHTHLIALTPSRTDTIWWKRMAVTANAIAFLDKRLTFKGAPNPAPFPSCLFYYGRSPIRFSRVLSGRALVVEV